MERSAVEQRRLLGSVLSNCTFDRGTLCPAYSKPFDIFANARESGNWQVNLGSQLRSEQHWAVETCAAAAVKLSTKKLDRKTRQKIEMSLENVTQRQHWL